MDSTRLAGRAPQFTATNGLPARSDAPWMARAMTSLPTPLSPRISTGMVDFAARWPSVLTRRMGAESPTRSSNDVLPLWRRFNRSTSAVRSPSCSALRIEIRIRSGLAGLTKKSWAPACMAFTTVSIPPVAVSTTTGVRTPAARASFRVSMPDMPGITRSNSTTSAPPPWFRRSSACWPFSACTTWNPSRSSTAWIKRRCVGSSSTTRTVFAIGDTHHFAAASDGPACLSRIETETGEDQV